MRKSAFVFFTLSMFFATIGFSKDKDSQTQIDTLKSEIEVTKKQILDLKLAKKAWQAGKSVKSEGGQESCDTCVGIANNLCKGKVSEKPRADVCFRVYKNKECFRSKKMTDEQRKKITDCWLVQNDIEVRDLEKELKKLKKDLKVYEGTASITETECPECEISKTKTSKKSR